VLNECQVYVVGPGHVDDAPVAPAAGSRVSRRARDKASSDRQGGRVRNALVVVGVLALAGCGSDGGRDAAPAPGPTGTGTITVTSPAFGEGQPVPREYTCRGAGLSPPLTWRGVPDSASSVAVVVTDPDAPRGTFVHWVLYDLPPQDGALEAGTAVPGTREAANSAGTTGWAPPCPPSGTHRYRFTVSALREPVRGGSTQQVLDAINRATVASGTLTGVVSAT
jgi:Raf kinase inhibitor-like YbhB/YbcL family protein